MAKVSSHPRPPAGFIWQATWILLPVVVLAVIAFISLRQDERAAEQDAYQRARENAHALAQTLGSVVGTELQRYISLQNSWTMELRLAGQPSVTGGFPDSKLAAEVAQWNSDHPGFNFTNLIMPAGEMLADGRFVDPLDFPAAPIPPAWFRELTSSQKKLWESLRAATTPPQIETARQHFLQSQPSTEAQQAAMDLFRAPDQLIGDSNAQSSETGLTFQEIACGQLLSVPHARLTAPLLQSIWWQVMNGPSFFSPKLLQMAQSLTNAADPAIAQKFYWTQLYWNARAETLASLKSFRLSTDLSHDWSLTPPSAQWINEPSGGLLTFASPTTFTNATKPAETALNGQGWQIHFVPQPVVEAILARAYAENTFYVPAYIQATVSIAGQNLLPTKNHAAFTNDSLLAQAASPIVLPINAATGLELNFYLISREQMLASERRREWLFAALTFGALLAALTGCLAAWRSFRRQLQLNEMKSNFVSSVSHELRAPIASVRLMAENLERGKISNVQKQNEYFHFIGQECRRLSSLIENVLDFSRIEQNRKQYDFEPTDLVAMVRQTLALMESYAAEKNVKLAAAPDWPAQAELNADGRALQQALVNLIDNAIKHSPASETVTVALKIHSANSNENSQSKPAAIHLAVTDHGPGIPPAEHAKIFERFYRRGSELRRETQGVGIGLSIVKHIVEAHDGQVLVQSQGGQGSCFTIILPVKNHPH